MKVAIIFNKDFSNVINTFGMQNKEVYNEKTVQNIAKALESNGHNVEIIDGNMNVIESLKGFMPKVLDGEKMGMVFNMAYGIQGESRYTHIPAMLEMLGIPYVGSNPSGHALALDKVIAKVLMQKHHISTPKFWVYSSHEEDMSTVEYPVIIKPKMEAVSFGLRVVTNERDLKSAVKYIIEEFQQQALVEQFIRGREFAVGIIGNNPPETFPVLEIDLNNDPDAIQSVEDKKKQPRAKICPAELPDKLALQIQEESIRAFQALQLNDFARVDIRLDKHGTFYILEINSMASLGKTGSYSFAAQAAGLSYSALVNKMLDVAAIRYFGQDYSSEEWEEQPLDPIHLKIRFFLRNRQVKYTNLLKSMVNINSHTRNIQGINKISAIIRKELTSLEFTCQVISQAEVGNLSFYTNSDDEKYDILLLGNVDHDIPIAQHRYFDISEQKIFGTGVWQNKGGLTILIAALQTLKSIKRLRKKKIGILITTDETIKNKASAAIIKRKSEDAKYIIGLSGAFLDGGIVTSRSGAATYDIFLNLINYESEENVSKASITYSKLVALLAGLSAPDKGILVSLTSLAFNSNLQNIYANGNIKLSVRYNESQKIKEIESRLFKSIPKSTKKLLDIYVNTGNKRPAMERTKNTEELWYRFKAMANKLDIRLREEHRWSSSNICFAPDSRYKIDGLGPIGIKDENKQEFILKHSLIERTALLAAMINTLER